MNAPPHTRADLVADLTSLGVTTGDSVLVHTSVRRLGRVLGGPDTAIAALREAVGHSGTILAYADWHVEYSDLVDDEGRVQPQWRDAIPAFDPQTSRANRDHGVLPEFLRTTPGALRSQSSGASVIALGAQAEHFTRDHPLDYGYGEGSPFARLVAAGGKVLMLGAPLDTMTLLHHAEHLAPIPDKRLLRYEVPFLVNGKRTWRMIEEFDTSNPVVEGLNEDYFADIVTAFLGDGGGAQGRVGDADTVLVSAADIVDYAVKWLTEWSARK